MITVSRSETSAEQPSVAHARRLRVLHVVPSFYPAVRYGGPIQTVLRMCQELLRLGVDLHVVTTDANGPEALDVPLDREVDVLGVPVRYFPRWRTNGFTASAPLAVHLRTVVRQFDLVHVTAAFSFPSTAACIAARQAGVPYVISPRGSCLPYARAQKRHKKLPYWWLFERENLRRASAIHVTSELERDELAKLLPSQELWLVPNGVDLPAQPLEVERLPKRVLFLGRLHPDKGLDRLLRAMSLVARKHPDAELVVAGPDDVGEWARLEGILRTLNPRPAVRYLGPVHGRAKDELLASAAMLVLPSFGSENFGQVVLEALAQGTPVIASRFTPWAILEERGAGRWVSNDPHELAGAITKLLGDDPTRPRMSFAARAVAEDFAWEGMASALRRRYDHLVSLARTRS